MTTATDARTVNNAVYGTLGERWYEAEDDPIALLRAESRHRNPWIAARIAATFESRPRASTRVLDLGCGGGFLANALAGEGYDVTGIDTSVEALAVAAHHDATRRVRYACADALALPYPAASFDVVCAMDFLEHIEDPARVVAEAARVLRPGGLFFFHTFNRNLLAWTVVIKGVEWFVRNTPRDMHVLRLFVKPRELRAHCADSGLDFVEVHGSMPVVFSRAFWTMLTTGRVRADFRFRFTPSLAMGYTGMARKRAGVALTPS